MQNVLIVSEVQSYLLVSLQEKLEESECIVTNIHANPDVLSKIKDDVDMIFIFADEELTRQHQGLTYLKDKALEDDIPIFVTGDPQEIIEIQKDIPLHLIQKEFPRPINVNEVAEAIESYLITFGKQNKKKILVVDDSGAMLRNVKGWLEDKYQVILANSGAMAIKYLSTNRPDLVLLDYEMPIVDGKQTLEMLRSEKSFEDIPVIFLTGRRDTATMIQVMPLKPAGYLLKDSKPADLKKEIDAFFASK